MSDDLDLYSPSGALVAVNPAGSEWQPILHISNQVVLYNPTSHALSIRRHSPPPEGTLARTHARCPYCHRSITPDSRRHHDDDDVEDFVEDIERASNRAANYFQLLEIANESSNPASPASGGSSAAPSAGPSTFRAENMAEGYFKAFFQEVCRLGMGANGSVYLCQVSGDFHAVGVPTPTACSTARSGWELSWYVRVPLLSHFAPIACIGM